MLKDILKLIDESTMFSKSAIASSLGLTIEVVEDMIEQLIRMGYLNKDESSPTCGDGGCKGCPFKNCNANTPTTFTITDKGYRLLNK